MKKRPRGLFFLIILALIVLISSRFIAGTLIDYAWWTELHQLDTWINLLLYGTVPILLAVLLFFAIFWTAFRLGIGHTPATPLFGFLKRGFVVRIAAVVLALFSIAIAAAEIGLGLAVVLLVFRSHAHINVDELRELADRDQASIL